MARPSLADSFVLSCIDPRLADDTTRHLSAIGMTDRYSEVRIAGAGLALVDPARTGWAQTVFENLATSVELHGVRRVVIVNHRDCGAMNLFAGRRLSDDPAAETETHRDVMERAAQAIRARHPNLGIELRLMDLDGSVRILPCQVCEPVGSWRAETIASVPQPGEAGASSEPATQPGFADLVRLRTRDGAAIDRAAETALLAEGVTRYGLGADAARQTLERVREEAGGSGGARAARDVAAFLRLRADPKGRIARREVEQGAGLYRALNGNTASAAQARARTASLAMEQGLRARPAGLWPFRSSAWLERMAATT